MRDQEIRKTRGYLDSRQCRPSGTAQDTYVHTVTRVFSSHAFFLVCTHTGLTVKKLLRQLLTKSSATQISNYDPGDMQARVLRLRTCCGTMVPQLAGVDQVTQPH